MTKSEAFSTELAAAIVAKEPPCGLLQRILNHFDAQTGTIHRLNPETGRLSLVAQIGVPEFLLERISDIPVGKGIAGAAARDRKAVSICNIQSDSSGSVRPDAKLSMMEGALAVPMIVDGELKGTLGIGKKTAHEWSSAETAEMEQIAAQIARL